MVFNYKDVVFKTYIHTVQISSSSLPLDEAAIATKRYFAQDKLPIMSHGRVRYAINPNKINKYCDSLEETITAIKFIIDDLMLSNYDWRIDRIDVSVNSYTPYDLLYKPACYIKELYAIKINEHKNSYRVIGDDLQKRSTVVKNSRRQLEIYNKEIESGKPGDPKTRFEFRYLRVSERKHRSVELACTWAIEQTIKALDSMVCIIPHLDKIKADILYQAYIRENSTYQEGRVRVFADFVTKFADYIYNRSQIYTLYNRLFSGNFTKWLHRYRKSGGNITLVGKDNIKLLCRKLKASLKQYVKSPKKEQKQKELAKQNAA